MSEYFVCVWLSCKKCSMVSSLDVKAEICPPKRSNLRKAKSLLKGWEKFAPASREIQARTLANLERKRILMFLRMEYDLR